MLIGIAVVDDYMKSYDGMLLVEDISTIQLIYLLLQESKPYWKVLPTTAELIEKEKTFSEIRNLSKLETKEEIGRAHV